MSMQDPISDMLTRLRNGCMSMQKVVSMPSSIMKTAIAEVLKQEGYIADYVVEGETKKVLKITMKYHGSKRQPVIENLQRVSKPSCRLYCGSQNIPKVKDGMGIAILSTSRGVLSGKDAEKQNVGGEILCYVW